MIAFRSFGQTPGDTLSHSGFAAAVDAIGWVPLMPNEVLIAAHYYPMAIRLDLPAVALGVLVSKAWHRRRLADDSGRWLGSYVPVALRCYPARLATVRKGNLEHDLELAEADIDGIAATSLPLREANGAPSATIASHYRKLSAVADGQLLLARALERLIIADVLVPLQPSMDARPPWPLMTIDARRLRALNRLPSAAIVRESFLPMEIAVSVVFSQGLLSDRLRPPRAPENTMDGTLKEAPSTASLGSIGMSPWLDTGDLVPTDLLVWQDTDVA